jgi:hypothetical protein
MESLSIFIERMGQTGKLAIGHEAKDFSQQDFDLLS